MGRSKYILSLGLGLLILLSAGCNVDKSTSSATEIFSPVPPTLPQPVTSIPSLTAEPASPSNQKPLIFDDDGSRDGTAALFYLLSNPEISIRAITISYGEAHPSVYIQYVGRALESIGKIDIPLGAGQDKPVAEGIPFPDWLRQLSDKFWDYQLPQSEKKYQFQDAPELMVSTIKQSSEPVTIFLSGTFTNLALALRQDPGIKSQIAAVYFMGGAVNVPGNITNLIPDSNNLVSEWNILADPQAAKEVFESGLALYMVPLDATNKVILSQNEIQPWRQGDAKANMVADLYDIMFNNYGFNSAEIFDLTAAVIMAKPESCVFQPVHLEVITDAGPTLGQTLQSSDGNPNINACLAPESNLIKNSLAETFSQ